MRKEIWEEQLCGAVVMLRTRDVATAQTQDLFGLELDYPKALFFPAWVPDLGPLWVISYVSPGICPSGIAPEPTSSSQQCVFASQVVVTTDSPRTIGTVGRVPRAGVEIPQKHVCGESRYNCKAGGD